MEVRTITIDRSKWRTGGDNGRIQTGLGNTQLLNPEGFMCCLGFACKELVPSQTIYDVPTPEFLEVVVKPLTYEKWEEGHSTIADSNFTEKAININDNGDITPAEKEAALIELCKKHPEAGIMFEFVGEFED